MPPKVYVEIFSGCGRLGRAVWRVTGWYVLLWDVLLGEEYDLRLAHNRRKLTEWLRCGALIGFHLGTPCESFTRARDVPPGPPPLRSDACPLGLPNLRPGDQLKVMTGNLWMRFSARMLTLACIFRVFATLENPQRSRLWICPPIMAVSRRRVAHLHVTHYCYWGMPYKKATSFLAINLRLNRLDNTLCVGARRGLCAFTGCPRQQLVGQDDQGRWRTKLAQPYPVRMCNALAKCLYDAEVEQIASGFDRLLAYGSD